jgi:hypothetical protein
MMLLRPHCADGPLFGTRVAVQKNPGPPKHLTVASQWPTAADVGRQTSVPTCTGQKTPRTYCVVYVQKSARAAVADAIAQVSAIDKPHRNMMRLLRKWRVVRQ